MPEPTAPSAPDLRLSPDGRGAIVSHGEARELYVRYDVPALPTAEVEGWARLVPAQAESDRDAAVALLWDAVGVELDEPCVIDHNQNCQAHGWFAYGEQPCHVARAKEFLARFPEDAAANQEAPDA